MMHSAVCTICDVKVELGVDTFEDNKVIYIEFNSLFALFNYEDKTVDDVTMALLNTPYRNQLFIDTIEVYEDHKDYCSKQLWITKDVLLALKEDSDVPFIIQAIYDFVYQNENYLILELNKMLD